MTCTLFVCASSQKFLLLHIKRETDRDLCRQFYELSRTPLPALNICNKSPGSFFFIFPVPVFVNAFTVLKNIFRIPALTCSYVNKCGTVNQLCTECCTFIQVNSSNFRLVNKEQIVKVVTKIVSSYCMATSLNKKPTTFFSL